MASEPGITYGGLYEPLQEERGYLGSKIGGRLALELPVPIPSCANCGKPMQFLAQIVWPEGAVEGPFKAAVIFSCSDPHGDGSEGCMTFIANEGANAVILLNRLVPTELVGRPAGPAHSISWHRELDIERSMEEYELEDFETDERFANLLQYRSKLNGWPFWIQSAEEASCPICGGQTEFLAQIDYWLNRDDEEAKPILLDEADFIGYSFICEKRCSPLGAAYL